MIYEEKTIETIPVGPLGLIPLKSCDELGEKVNQYLIAWRHERESEHKSTIAFAGYQRDSYIIRLRLLDSVQERAKAPLKSLFGATIYISW